MTKRKRRRKIIENTCTAMVVVFALSLAVGVSLLIVSISKDKKNQNLVTATTLVEYNTSAESLGFSENVETTEETFVSMDAIEIPGLGDLTLTPAQGVVLINPVSNCLYMQYNVVNADTGESIYKTLILSPGEETIWIPGECVEAGEYSLRVEVYSFNNADEEGVLRTNNDIKLCIASTTHG